MHVREGNEATRIDDDVAFRTTYYFRVFDYCEVRKRTYNTYEPDAPEAGYIIIPVSDSFYRFRMTGKASTLANVKFESGTLKSWEIDPFGANVIFDEELDRFRFQSVDELKEEVAKKEALGDLQQALDLYTNQFGGDVQQLESVRKDLEESMGAAISRFNGNAAFEEVEKQTNTADVRNAAISVVNVYDEVFTEIDDLYTSIKGADNSLWNEFDRYLYKANPVPDEVERHNIIVRTFVRGYYGFDNQDTIVRWAWGFNDYLGRPGIEPKKEEMPNPLIEGYADWYTRTQPAEDVAEAKRLQDEEDAAKKAGTYVPPQEAPEQQKSRQPSSAGVTPTIDCPKDAPIRRGFQVLGPEGWRTFDQDERLIMAMSSDATPLTSTLKDLSSRVLNARASSDAVARPIAEERVRIARAQSSLGIAATDDKKQPYELCAAAVGALATPDADAGKTAEAAASTGTAASDDAAKKKKAALEKACGSEATGS